MSFSTFFRIMGVTSSLNHHLRVKYPLVTVGQVPVKHVQIILPQAGFGCERSEGVVGVLTLLVGGVAQAFHDDRVVELRVQLGVEDVEGKDREEQVEVEREKRVKEGAPWMTMEMVMMRLRT